MLISQTKIFKMKNIQNNKKNKHTPMQFFSELKTRTFSLFNGKHPGSRSRINLQAHGGKRPRESILLLETLHMLHNA